MGSLAARNTQKTEEGDTESFWWGVYGRGLALLQTLNGHFGKKQEENLYVARSTPLGTISVPPSSACSVFGAASGGCWRLEVFNSER